LYFNSACSHEEIQCLSAFLTVFFYSPEGRELMKKIFLPTLRSTIYAPLNSNLRNVSAQQVGNFLISLVAQESTVSEDSFDAPIIQNPSKSEDWLSRSILLEICSNPTGPESKQLPKLLSCINPNISKESEKLICFLIEASMKSVVDKTSLKSISKFQSSVKRVFQLSKEESDSFLNILNQHKLEKEKYESKLYKPSSAKSKSSSKSTTTAKTTTTSATKKKMLHKTPKKVRDASSSEDEEDDLSVSMEGMTLSFTSDDSPAISTRTSSRVLRESSNVSRKNSMTKDNSAIIQKKVIHLK